MEGLYPMDKGDKCFDLHLIVHLSLSQWDLPWPDYVKYHNGDVSSLSQFHITEPQQGQLRIKCVWDWVTGLGFVSLFISPPAIFLCFHCNEFQLRTVSRWSCQVSGAGVLNECCHLLPTIQFHFKSRVANFKAEYFPVDSYPIIPA